MKKILLILSFVTPLALLANEAGASTDILQRTVNFFIFVAIFYYLLADKAKAYFGNRTASIQGELDKVQELLKESEAKVNDAKTELENAKHLASEIVQLAHNDVEKIKSSIESSVEKEISYLMKSFEDKLEVESKKVTKEIVSEVLNELLDSDNIELSQNDLADIVIKKVA